MYPLNETHDPALESWVASANDPSCDFPIQNLPYCVYRPMGEAEFRCGLAIGAEILDLTATPARAALGPVGEAFAGIKGRTLNAFMALSPAQWSQARLALSRALRKGAAAQSALAPHLTAQHGVEYGLPAAIGDYTDFYVGIHHATAVGKLFRPDAPLLPNYKYVPIGYHGRASSIVVSGAPVRRPLGQTRGAQAPAFGPSNKLDYELELGLFIGGENALGAPTPMRAAEARLFGVTLFNDWSARDIQAWEYQPLGPFLAKNFASTVSPFVVTLEALAPFRAPFTRPEGDPAPLPYLDSAANRQSGALDIVIEAFLETAAMRAKGLAPQALSRGNAREAAYWTPAQLIAHHTIGGCNLQPGDLLGSGTLSGPQLEQAGSLLELTQDGKAPITLPSGETRTFLQDGDAVIFRAHCARAGARRIGFGACRGEIAAAPDVADIVG
jgi:fumarylacetoacetase